MRVEHELSARDLGYDLTGQVVLCWANTAACDDHVRPVQRAADDLFHTLKVVANDAFVKEVDAKLCKPLRHPRCIGIDNLAQ